MSFGRPAIGYVVQVDGPEVMLNLNENHRGQVASHSNGITFIGQPSDLIGVDGGADVIVLRVMAISYAEPREAHQRGVGKITLTEEPLRQIRARAVGFVAKERSNVKFVPQEWRLPQLGAEAFPLSDTELRSTTSLDDAQGPKLLLGWDARTGLIPIEADVDKLFGRHLAVLGATGSGKTHFVAAITQQLLRVTNQPRIIVFDINGEYARAFSHLGEREVKRTIIGRRGAENADYYRIPYYALGRHGLGRLLLPSEKTQMPALRFAIEHLQYVQSTEEGAMPAGDNHPVFFDDCRREGAADARDALERIRSGQVQPSNRWPHMRALACLAAEWYSLQPGRNGVERNAFMYGHVQSLINRIRGLVEDERFQDVVAVEGGTPIAPELDWQSEGSAVVERIFGPREFTAGGWKVHVVDLSRVAQDLMPFVLGSVLELFASELFLRGPSGTHPTLLVLEEAHHYLRQLPSDAESGQHQLAYERLAKEGRKFSLSLLVSTQRPSELSPTVLAQCGTWAVLRLTNEQDQRAVAAASESGSGFVLKQIPGLPRGHAVVFGAALPVPAVVSVVKADPEPDSNDPPFSRLWNSNDLVNEE